MKKLFLLLTILFLFAACDRLATQQPLPNVTQNMKNNYTTSLLVGSNKIFAQIVSTPESMAQGLSGRGRLNDDQGMLFDFGQPQTPAFWMKDMNFDLDFVWISNGKIIGITKDVPAPISGTADDQLKLYYPPSAINWVLEVNSGWVDEHKIKTGDEVRRE
jgi:uncharacterized membrane protein (UPF0127 family)